VIVETHGTSVGDVVARVRVLIDAVLHGEA